MDTTDHRWVTAEKLIAEFPVFAAWSRAGDPENEGCHWCVCSLTPIAEEILKRIPEEFRADFWEEEVADVKDLHGISSADAEVLILAGFIAGGG